MMVYYVCIIVTISNVHSYAFEGYTSPYTITCANRNPFFDFIIIKEIPPFRWPFVRSKSFYIGLLQGRKIYLLYTKNFN